MKRVEQSGVEGYRLPSSAALAINTDFSRRLVSSPVESG